jgi:phosphotransferase system HPr-like phosphotransfer protein
MKSSLIKAVKVVIVLGFSMQAYANKEYVGNAVNADSNVNINRTGVKQNGDLNVIQGPDSDLITCQKALKSANNINVNC